MKCWYCGAPLGDKAYQVPDLLGFYCYRCALLLCGKYKEPVIVKVDNDEDEK